MAGYDANAHERFKKDVQAVTSEVASLLIEKNAQYGNAALDPLRVFARDVNSFDQLSVRLDDKLSRLMRGAPDMDPEDVELDILGYMVLRRIAKMRMDPNSPADGHLPEQHPDD